MACKFIRCPPKICALFVHSMFANILKDVQKEPLIKRASPLMLDPPALPPANSRLLSFPQAPNPHYQTPSPTRGSNHLWATSHHPSPEDDPEPVCLGLGHAASTQGTGVLGRSQEDGMGRTHGCQPHLHGSLVCPQQSQPSLVSSHTMGSLTWRKSEPLFQV